MQGMPAHRNPLTLANKQNKGEHLWHTGLTRFMKKKREIKLLSPLQKILRGGGRRRCGMGRARIKIH